MKVCFNVLIVDATAASIGAAQGTRGSYFSVVSVVFVFSASPIAFPASSPSSFPSRLRREYMIAKDRDKIPDTVQEDRTQVW